MDAHPDHAQGESRAICGLMMFEGDNALKKVSVLSGGEKSRVLLGKLLVSPANLLMLDEPTNHLDMESIDSLIEAIEAFDGAVIIVTHSELMLEAVATRLIVYDNDTISLFEGTYLDFLERVGWSEEGGPKKKKQKKNADKGFECEEQREQGCQAPAHDDPERPLESAGPSRYKDRIPRSDHNRARKSDVEKDTQELAAASSKGEALAIRTLSVSLREAQQKIEQPFCRAGNAYRGARRQGGRVRQAAGRTGTGVITHLDVTSTQKSKNIYREGAKSAGPTKEKGLVLIQISRFPSRPSRLRGKRFGFRFVRRDRISYGT